MYVTNGIMHAKKLTQKGCIVYLIGGELKEATLALVGEEAMKTLGRYHFTKGFFGTNGIHKRVDAPHRISGRSRSKRWQS